MLKVGVLASGNGSNLQSLLDNSQGKYEVVCVISDNASAFAIERARKHNITPFFVDHRFYHYRDIYDQALVEILHKNRVNLVALAGFMRIITPVLINAFPNAIMNIHPALLPSFPGLHAQRQALEYGVRFSGCTVHFVDEGTDTGPIIIQAAVPVMEKDTEETLSSRILIEEHRIYPEAVKLFAERRLRINGRKVEILPRKRHNPR